MLTTVRRRESTLTAEERRRNSRGSTLVFVSRHHLLARVLVRGTHVFICFYTRCNEEVADVCRVLCIAPPALPPVDAATAAAAAADAEKEKNKLAADRLRAQLMGDAEAERAIDRRLHVQQQLGASRFFSALFC